MNHHVLLIAQALILAIPSVGVREGDIQLLDPVGTIAQLQPEQVLALGSGGALRVDHQALQFDRGPGLADIEVSLDESLESVGSSESYEMFADRAGDLAVYAESGAGSGRIYFALGDESAAGRLSVKLPLDDGASLVTAGRNAAQYLEMADQTVLVFAPPWAVDASGRALETSLRLEGDELVQHVELTGDTVFPVLADPAWTYALKYDVGARTPSSASSALHSCFDCYFPVAGAPSTFPALNQLLPLTVGTMNFECRFGAESFVNEPTWVQWEMFFNATSNHVDGAGSGIAFSVQFFPGDSTYSLLVSAYIVNENPGGVPQWLYLAGATVNWLNFANNLYISP